ncbi:MAG: nickel/cobalt transporter [Sneathiellaceae bacterium]
MTAPSRAGAATGWLCLAVLLLAALPAGLALAAVPAGTGAGAAADPGLWDRALAWIFTEQRAWHRDLVAQLRALAEAPAGKSMAGWALIGASFLYGLFHAAGPGHGKIVLTSYLLTQGQQVRRGILLAAASAFCQGAVAIVLILGVVHLAGLLPRDTRLAVDWTGRASFALLIALGLWLALRALRDGARLMAPASVAIGPDGAAQENSHGLSHGHGHDHACGHAHGPTAAQLSNAESWRGALAVILSIGLRPCSGAVLVLVLAQALDLPLAGLAAVLAMSTGTAIAVAALALLTVHARDWAARLAGGRSAGRRTAFAGATVRLAGGLVILALGGSLLAASFAPAHPLGM